MKMLVFSPAFQPTGALFASRRCRAVLTTASTLRAEGDPLIPSPDRQF